jgi:DNA-binding transcriptional LysR family regulator
MYENGLEAFWAILNYGGFSIAAEKLNLTQSTISHRLMELEKKIGARLIERGKDLRTVELTLVGKKLLPIAEKWRETTEDIQGIMSMEQVISLSIVTVDTVNSYIFPPLYRLLSRNNVNLKISSRKSAMIPLLIEKREFDIGYTFQVTTTPNTVVRELFREKIVLLRSLGDDSDAQKTFPIDNHSLRQEDEVYFDTWGPGYEIWHNQWWGFDKLHRLEIDTPSVFNSLVNNPRQWSLVPYCMARHFVDTGKFMMQALKNPPPERICYEIQNRYVRHSSQLGVELLKRFMEQLHIDT